MSKERSKKYRSTVTNKKELWNIFDSEINDKKDEPLECIYRACGDREKCECCDSSLAFSDEGFLTCINTKC